MFTLPTLKPYHKYKLTALEGACVRKCGICEFGGEGDYSEYCMASCSNLGDLMLLSTPDLRKQFNSNITRKDDVKYVPKKQNTYLLAFTFTIHTLKISF